MAASNVSVRNHGAGSQNVQAGDGPQNNYYGTGPQYNNSIIYGSNDTNIDEATMLRNEKEDCLGSLIFEHMDARKEDISIAHPETCDWFFEITQFQQWYRRENLQDHNGVLWIKGNPGTGKSTLMKHILKHLEEDSSNTPIIAAHFFNARGDYSERTPLGMLRSILYQLLEKESSIYDLFVPLFRKKVRRFKTNWNWRESDLNHFLLSEIHHYNSKPLIILVDALDECEEIYARDVVKLLEALSIKAIGAGVTLNICLSSRHYPNISMEPHLELALETRSEHHKDIVLYTRETLTKRCKHVEQEFFEDIEREILEKASGIFMWAVLVIKLLVKAYDAGKKETMRGMLHDVPRDLEHVFEALLFKDNPDKHETVFMLQFVLLARRVLKPEELYFAMLAKTTESIQAWDQSETTLDDIRRRIINSSKGLIEIRKSGTNAVQFIHKSVNDFLIRNKRLQKLDPDLHANALGSSHECLRSCCMTYITTEAFQLATDREQLKAFESSYPFLKYASTYALDHAEEAEKYDCKQAEFLQHLLEEPSTLEKMRALHNAFEEYPGSGCARGVTLLHMLAFHGYNRLTKALLDEQFNINAQGGVYGHALQAAIVQSKEVIVKLLLEEGADVNAQGGFYGNALQAAAVKGNETTVKSLLRKGANVNAHGGIYGYALSAAIVQSKEVIVKLLLEEGADVNAQGGFYGNALCAASAEGNIETVEELLQRGADVNTQGGPFGYALQAAVARGETEIIELLLRKGADVHAKGGVYGYVLCAAAVRGQPDIIKLLLSEGADIDAQGGPYGNALCAAAIENKAEAVRILLDRGADVNAQGGPYNNAFCAAEIGDETEAVRLLLESGADINYGTETYGNAFQIAALQGSEEIMELLAGKRTNVDLKRKFFNNGGAQLNRASPTNRKIAEILHTQRVNLSALTKGNYGVVLTRTTHERSYYTMEMLLKANIDASNQWLYDYYCWSALGSWSFGYAARLIEKGANVNAYVDGFPIDLPVAMIFDAEEMIAVLLENGADINAPMFYTKVEAEEQMPE